MGVRLQHVISGRNRKSMAVGAQIERAEEPRGAVFPYFEGGRLRRRSRIRILNPTNARKPLAEY